MSIKDGMIIRNEMFEVIPFSEERKIECFLHTPNEYDKNHLADKNIDIRWYRDRNRNYASFLYKDIEIKRIKAAELLAVKDQLNVFLKMPQSEIETLAEIAGKTRIDELSVQIRSLGDSKAGLHRQIIELQVSLENLSTSIDEVRKSLQK